MFVGLPNAPSMFDPYEALSLARLRQAAGLENMVGARMLTQTTSVVVGCNVGHIESNCVVGPGHLKRGQATRDLERENRELRQELAILKKALHIFRKDQK